MEIYREQWAANRSRGGVVGGYESVPHCAGEEREVQRG